MRNRVLAALVVVAALIALAGKASAATYAYTVSSVNCRVMPTIRSPIVATLPAGAPLAIYDRTGHWYEVDCAGVLGYVHSSFVAFVRHGYRHYHKAKPKLSLPVPHARRFHGQRTHRRAFAAPKHAMPRGRPHLPLVRMPRTGKRLHVRRFLRKPYGGTARHWHGEFPRRGGVSIDKPEIAPPWTTLPPGFSGRWRGGHAPDLMPPAAPAAYAVLVDDRRILTL